MINKLVLEAAEPLELERATRLQNVPKPPMLVENLLPKGSITLIAGPTYSGKTFFAMELARAVILGKPFMRHFEVATRGNVLFIEQDSPKYDTGRALWAMLRDDYESAAVREEQMYSDLDSLYMSWHPGLNIKNAKDIARIAATANRLATYRGETISAPMLVTNSSGDLEEISDGVEEHGYQGASLIILDTFRSLHTSEENSSTEMEAIMQGIKQLRQATKAAIVLVHHGPKPTLGQPDFIGVRGSTAIEGAVDTIFKINSNRKTKQSSCTVVKARAIQTPDFHYRIITEEKEGFLSKRVEFAGEIIRQEEESIENSVDSASLLLYIKSNQGLSREDTLTWASLNGKSPSTITKWVNKLVEAGTLRAERDKDGTRYWGKEN
jgi:hypothetical protein